MLGQRSPRIPYRADELARDAVATRRAQEDSKLRAFLERRAARLLLLECAVVKRLSDLPGAGVQHLVEQAGVQGAGRDRIDVYSIFLDFFGERFDEAHDSRLRNRISADPGQRVGGAAARELDDLSALLRLEGGQYGAAHEDRAVEVDVYGARPFPPIDLLNDALRAVHPRVVHEDID